MKSRFVAANGWPRNPVTRRRYHSAPTSNRNGDGLPGTNCDTAHPASAYTRSESRNSHLPNPTTSSSLM